MAKTKVSAEVLTLTPELASELLESNVGHQRSLSRNRVETYAREIVEGNFVLTGQGIVIDKNGHMIDGQHRCAAVLMAGKPIKEMLIVRGIDPKAFAHLDTGKQRGAADVLTIEGFKSATNLAALTRIILGYELSGELHMRFRESISNAEILNAVRSDPFLQDITAYYSKFAKQLKPLGLGAVVGAFHVILSRANVKGDTIEEFMNGLILGEDLKRNHPIMQFRFALLESTNSPTHRMQIRTKDARLIKTWNAFYRGESGPRITQWNSLKDEYPKIIFRYK